LIRALKCSEWEGLHWRLVQIGAAAQPRAFETSHRNGDGGAIVAPNFAQGGGSFFLSVGTSKIGKCQVRLSSCRVPSQTSGKMHLNVPGEKESQLQMFRRKCKWMLIGVLAPEYVAALAISERHSAWKLVTQVCINPTFARDDQ
jgi:hypothetical protein